MEFTQHRSVSRFVSIWLGGLGLVATAFASPAAAVSCGDVLGPGGEFQLTEDLGPCDDATGPAVTVDSAFLDLNGFTITCSDTNPANAILPVGILVVGSKALVGNGTVVGCQDGVEVAGEGRGRVGAMEVSGNSRFGVLVNSDKNLVGFMDSIANGVNGIQVDGDRNVLFNIVADANGEDGIEVDGGKNKLFVNACTNNDDGFDIDGTGNTLVSNLAGNNHVGFAVGGADNKLVKNSALANTTEGFELFLSSGSLKFVKNSATANGASGVLVSAPAEVVIKAVKTTATDNHIDSGFDIEELTPGCGAHLWKKSTFGTASDACVQ